MGYLHLKWCLCHSSSQFIGNPYSYLLGNVVFFSMLNLSLHVSFSTCLFLCHFQLVSLCAFTTCLFTLHFQLVSSSVISNLSLSELGASLLQIALSLFPLERNLISGAKERYKKKSKEGRATSELPNSHFEQFALDQYKEKRAN